MRRKLDTCLPAINWNLSGRKREINDGIDMEACETVSQSLDLLPSELLTTILNKLDVNCICSVAFSCKALKSCVSQIFSILPKFHLHGVALSKNFLRPMLLPNPFLQSLKVDCSQLDDSAIKILMRPSLDEMCLHNCADFSGKLLFEIGVQCKDLRSLYLGSVAKKRGRSIHISDLEELLRHCRQLETLVLMFDIPEFPHHSFAKTWALASSKLTSLEFGYISSVMITELLRPNVGLQLQPIINHLAPAILSNIEKLCLSVDYISDSMVSIISKGLAFLTHLDLRDAPIAEPRVTMDLSNYGLQQINQHGKLKHLSLVRSQEFLVTHFKRVNDLGILLMADRCSNMASICLGGFCRVTDTGFRAILHSCSILHELRVSHGNQLTDLVFHDITATSLSLTHVSLRWCHLLTNCAVMHLTSNSDIRVLDLRDCRGVGDVALEAISHLLKLTTLLLDGSDITDSGLSCIRLEVMCSLVSLSLRGCKRLTDKCISSIFDGSLNHELHDLDLSNLPKLSDNGILLLAKTRVPIVELRLRQCQKIGDVSIMALASMQIDKGVNTEDSNNNNNRWHGSNLRLLDLYNCGGITPLAFRWLRSPYFPRLRWLGVSPSWKSSRDMVDDLVRSRPFLNVACRGEKLGSDERDDSVEMYMHVSEEVDELQQHMGQDSETLCMEDDIPGLHGSTIKPIGNEHSRSFIPFCYILG